MDSSVKFSANLLHANGTEISSPLYKYKWEDSINFFGYHPDKLTSFGDEYSNVSFIYHSEILEGGRYEMSVHVFRKKDSQLEEWSGNEDLIAESTMNFTLTGIDHCLLIRINLA